MTQPRKPFNLKNKGQGLGAPKLSFRLPALTQSILHGWPLEARTLFRVHCVVPAGGLSLDRTRWIRARDNYFLPKKVLGELFRGKFVDALKEAFQHGQLQRRTLVTPPYAGKFSDPIRVISPRQFPTNSQLCGSDPGISE